MKSRSGPFKGFLRFIALIAMLSLTSTSLFPLFAEASDEVAPSTAESTQGIMGVWEGLENHQPEATGGDSEDPFSTLSPEAMRNAYLLIKLQQYLNRAEQNYNSLGDRMEDARTEIDANRYAISTLEEQLTQLESLIQATEDKILNVEIQIAEKERDIETSLEAIEFNELEIEQQKRALEAYLQLLYFEKNINYDGDNRANELKIILQEGSISQVLQDSTYLSLLEEQSESLMTDLKALERTVKRQNYELTVKRQHLQTLRDELEGEHRNLSAQWEGKQNLLDETKGSDEVYRELYASYRLAQEAILDEINLFQTNIGALEDKVSTSSMTMTPEELAMIQDIQSEAANAYSIREAADFIDLDWPVSPASGLTAFFDDEGYVRAFGVAHHAVDVRITHGSIIYAPADGVVYRVYDAAALDDPDARLGYGYMIIAHSKGVMTLYGHISAALVNEGDFVRRGQIIGLTGATPGTPGAGARTTGAHLHFEVFQNGVRVDPLEYLPLEEVPLDSLPDEYLIMLQEQLQTSLEEENVSLDAFEDLEQEAQETIDENIFLDDAEDEDSYWTNGEI